MRPDIIKAGYGQKVQQFLEGAARNHRHSHILMGGKLRQDVQNFGGGDGPLRSWSYLHQGTVIVQQE